MDSSLGNSFQRVLQDGDKTFVYGLDLISVKSPNAKGNVQTDRLGSVVIGTDETSVVMSLIDYDAWGVPEVVVQGLLTPNYTGHAYDDVLGIENHGDSSSVQYCHTLH